MKYKASYGSSASPAIVAQIEDELANVLRDGVPALPPRADLIHSLDVRTPYLETLDGLVDWDRLRAAKFRFVIDPMHGAGRGLLRELFRRHGIACDEIRGNRDPLFGGVNPEPIEPHIDALQRAVRAGQLRRRLRARWRRRPHRRDGSRRHVHHAAPDFLDPALASRRHAQTRPATSPKLFPPRK